MLILHADSQGGDVLTTLSFQSAPGRFAMVMSFRLYNSSDAPMNPAKATTAPIHDAGLTG